MGAHKTSLLSILETLAMLQIGKSIALQNILQNTTVIAILLIPTTVFTI